MLENSAQITTVAAGRYLKRLCKHFNHKVAAQWDEHQGSIDFDIGRCFLQATDSALSVRCEAGDAESLQQLMATLKDHFERFARREQLQLIWDRS